MTALADVKDIVRGGLATLSGFSGRLIARAILMIFAGRVYGIEALGLLGQVAAISEMAAAICVVGLQRSLLDMMSRDVQEGKKAETQVFNALVLSLILGVIVTCVLLVVWTHMFPDQYVLIGLICLVVPATIFIDIALTTIKFKRVVRWDVLARCLFEPWAFLGLALVFWFQGWSEHGLIYAYVGSVITAAIVAAYGLRRVVGFKSIFESRLSVSHMKRIFVKSLPVGVTDMSIMALRRIDLVVLGVFVGPAAVGLYYMVQQLVTIPHKIGGAFQPMLSPVIADLHNQKQSHQMEKKLSNVCRWIFSIQLIISVPMMVYGSELLSVFGPEFAIGGTVLIIVLLAELLDGSFLSAETPLVYSKPRIPPTLLILTLIIEIGFIAFLSNLYGVIGAAIGFLIALGFLNASRLFMLARHMKIQVISKDFAPPLIAAIGVTVLLFAVRWGLPNNIWIASLGIISAVGIYALALKTFGLTKTDQVLIRLLTKKKTKAVI